MANNTVAHAGSVGGLAVGGIIGGIIADGPGALLGMFVGGFTTHYALSSSSRHGVAVNNEVAGPMAVVQQIVGSWQGTLVGGALGLLVAGPVGAVIGGGIGYLGRDAHQLDQPVPPAPPAPPA